MQLVDTHCHIHEKDYEIGAKNAIKNAVNAGVVKMICVGTSADDSSLAVDFVQNTACTWASIGHHPHYAKSFSDKQKQTMKNLADKNKVVAVGECGLDYWYLNSDKKSQEDCLRWQLNLAKQNNLPVIFHNRGSKQNPQDAFDELWEILEDYPDVRGVIHSFSADKDILEQILTRNFYVGINGIMTFTKDLRQLDALDAIPVKKLVLETDAPFLTPVPLRGKINEPKNLVRVAEFIAQRRNISLEELAQVTTQNAEKLFNLS